jgi:hypothetical protein
MVRVNHDLGRAPGENRTFRNALLKGFNPEAIVEDPDFVLARRTSGSRKTLFGRVDLEVQALLFLSTDTIDFPKYLGALRASLGQARHGRIACSWIVCSGRGGIYLHEAVSTKENMRLDGVRSRFAVLNTCDGGLSFGPGHPANKGVSGLMRSCLEDLRAAPGPSGEKRLEGLLSLCFEMTGKPGRGARIA